MDSTPCLFFFSLFSLFFFFPQSLCIIFYFTFLTQIFDDLGGFRARICVPFFTSLSLLNKLTLQPVAVRLHYFRKINCVYVLNLAFVSLIRPSSFSTINPSSNFTVPQRIGLQRSSHTTLPVFICHQTISI